MSNKIDKLEQFHQYIEVVLSSNMSERQKENVLQTAMQDTYYELYGGYKLKDKVRLIKNDKALFCDMDGVLANYWSEEEDKTNPWEKVGFFLNRPVDENVRDALRLLHKAGLKVSIISAVNEEFSFAKEEKIQWLKDNGLSWIDALIVPCFKNKADFVHAQEGHTYVLLDDYNKNLNQWESCHNNGAKFCAIKYLNGINGSTEQWTGRTVYHKSDAESIANMLVDMMLMM